MKMEFIRTMAVPIGVLWITAFLSSPVQMTLAINQPGLCTPNKPSWYQEFRRPSARRPGSIGNSIDRSRVSFDLHHSDQVLVHLTDVGRHIRRVRSLDGGNSGKRPNTLWIQIHIMRVFLIPQRSVRTWGYERSAIKTEDSRWDWEKVNVIPGQSVNSLFLTVQGPISSMGTVMIRIVYHWQWSV